MNKTNALRILDQKKIPYEAIEYDGSLTDGESIASVLGEKCDCVFKTLVTVANTREHLVFVLPVDKALDLKKAAVAAGVKNVEMIKQKDLLPLTGYIHGGCSPVGMKKQFRTFIFDSAQALPFFYVSAGKVGMQMKVAPADIAALTGAEFASFVTEKIK